MLKSRIMAVSIAAFTIVVASILLVDRGGLIAWGAFVFGSVLLAKIWLRPSKVDPGLSVMLATLPVFAWVGTLYYVISTWESGEVVDLAINTGNGAHTARVWVLDIGASPLIYYDAAPEVAKSLLAGKPVRLTRAGVVSTRIPKAIPVDALPEAEANLVLDAMRTKYGDRMGAAEIYYSMLGRSRDRVAVVANLIEE